MKRPSASLVLGGFIMSASGSKTGPGRIVRFAILFALTLGALQNMQAVKAQECPEPAPQSSGSHSFRHVGETFDIPITLGDCQAISLTLRWSNGRNNGSLFNLTFFDGDERPLYTKQISAFLTGMFEFPLMPVEQQSYGLVSLKSVPALVTVQSASPFGPPAVLSYTITRANRRPRGRLRGIDTKLATTLQTAPGTLLSTTSAYTLTELALPQPRELEVPSKRKTVRSAFRLQLAPEAVAAAGNAIDLIWIDDIAVPVYRTSGDPGASIGALIFDDAVLKNGAEISVSNLAANRFQSFPDRLVYQSKASTLPSDLAVSEEGNVVTSIKNAARVIGGRRQSLVQIQLQTNRPFPARESALRLQVGKRVFVEELAGDYTGRTLTLTLTPEMFAELKDGAAIMAFYGKPDGSGSSGAEVWYFGRLNKSAIQ
jgi:hypothetical protein